MEQESQPNQGGSLPLPEIDLEALRRDLEYVHAESDDYYAYEFDTGKKAWAPTR